MWLIVGQVRDMMGYQPDETPPDSWKSSYQGDFCMQYRKPQQYGNLELIEDLFDCS